MSWKIEALTDNVVSNASRQDSYSDVRVYDKCVSKTLKIVDVKRRTQQTELSENSAQNGERSD